MARRRQKKKRSRPPVFCQITGPDNKPCGARIAWLSGVPYAVNPGPKKILLHESGYPQIRGVTLQGDECWGRERLPNESGRVVEIWTRHVCQHREGGRPIPRPAPDPDEKWGVDRSLGEREDDL